MTSHAALGVVRAGVAILKDSGVRINCISPGQIDLGVEVKAADPEHPSQRSDSQEANMDGIGLGRTGMPQEVAKTAGFLASGFSSYMTGQNIVVDGGALTMSPLTIPFAGSK
ncbi:MAG: hypothetical protein M1816_005372 [Peltula sp. TS41687]|nr:MAG: hypothetical protein M1816_005372 [Peltula sp. TS41687]